MNESFLTVVSFFSLAAIHLVSSRSRNAGLFLGILAVTGFACASLAAGSSSCFSYAFAVLMAFSAAHSYAVNSPGASGVSDRARENAGKIRALEKTLKKNREEYSSLARSEKETLAMYSVIKVLSEAADMDSVRVRFCRYAGDILGVRDFGFYVQNYDGELLLFCRGGNFNFNFPRYVRERKGIPVEEPFFDEEKRLAVIPVRCAGDLCGFFVGADIPGEREKFFGKSSDFFGQVAFALRRLQLFAQVDLLSRIDAVTGVFRRNVLNEKLDEEMKRARSFRTTFAFMIADIDHFKEVNDRYGHQFGDFVLKKTGDILKSSVYETDFIARYGGEEFALILPRADSEGVLRKAEAIREKMERESFTIGFESVKITVSIGIAHFPRDASTASTVVKKADRALYWAKENGRNRVADFSSIA